MPKLKEVLFGGKNKTKSLSLNTASQDELLNLIQQGLTSGEGPLAELFGNFDEEAFNKGVKQPALQDFQDNILPSIQEKFIAGNQALGSGMRRGQLKAGTDLQAKLAQLMYGAQQDQKNRQVTGLQTALGKQGVENVVQKGNPGLAAPLLGKAVDAGMAALTGGTSAVAGGI